MCDFICPKCKSSHHRGCDVGFRTLMYFQPEYVNGVNINPDRNTTTSTVECLECNSTEKIVK